MYCLIHPQAIEVISVCWCRWHCVVLTNPPANPPARPTSGQARCGPASAAKSQYASFVQIPLQPKVRPHAREPVQEVVAAFAALLSFGWFWLALERP